MNVAALLFAIFLLAANGFFVAAEFALLASRRSKIEQLAAEGSRAAVSALRGLRELSLMLAGAQLGITMASFGLGAVAEPAVAAGIESLLGGIALPSGARHAIAFAIALTIVVFLHMVVGEMAPKSWAISHPEPSALLLARPFRAFALIFRPFIRILNGISNGVVRLCGVEPQDERAMVHSPSDLVLLLNESHERGHLGDDQRKLLHRALEMSGLDAEAAMVPRRDIVAASAESTVEELELLASSTGRSRLPIYDGELDQLRGVLHVKDLLAVTERERGTTTAGDLARPALVTPESRPVEDLMLEMAHEGQHIALVVDEYGTITGLVALEDLLEELIGDFEDESDPLAGAARRNSDGTISVPGSMRPHELRAEAGIHLPEGEWETIAGYTIAALGRLPGEGDRVTVDGAELTVARMDGYRVAEFTIRRGPLAGSPDASAAPGALDQPRAQDAADAAPGEY